MTHTLSTRRNSHPPIRPMAQRVRFWSGGAGLTQTSIQFLLYSEGLKPIIWSGTANDVYYCNKLPNFRILWVAKGSMIVRLPDIDQRFILQHGDRLDVPPDTAHELKVGPEGVLCVEAR